MVVVSAASRNQNAWTFLTELKSNPSARNIPVLVATVVDNERKARALGADEFLVKPIERETLLQLLQQYTIAIHGDKILIVDDEEVSRYLLKGLLSGVGLPIVEATNGKDALKLARQLRPRVIFLDLMIPEVSGYELLSQLRADPMTASIPVIVNTSKELSQNERELLAADTVAIMRKEGTSQEQSRAVYAALAKAGIAPEPEATNVS